MSHRTQVRLPGLNHRLVMELDRGHVREMLLVMGLAALMLLPVLLYVWQSSNWIRSGYQIEKLKNQRDRLAEIHHQLQLEKASLESLARIEHVALDQLGLAEPPGGTVVLIETARPAPRSGNVAAAGPLSPSQERHAARDRIR